MPMGESWGEPLAVAGMLCWCCPGLCPHGLAQPLGGRARGAHAAEHFGAAENFGPSWLPAAAAQPGLGSAHPVGAELTAGAWI